MSTRYKVLTDLDLERNNLVNVSSITGDNVDGLGKDLAISTQDTTSGVGDVIIKAGSGSEYTGGHVHIFAGTPSTTADVDGYYDDSSISRGIQVNADSSISIKADSSTSGTVTITGAKEVKLTDGQSTFSLNASTTSASLTNSTTNGSISVNTGSLSLAAANSLGISIGTASATVETTTGTAITRDGYQLTVTGTTTKTSYEVLDNLAVRKNSYLKGNVDVNGSTLSVSTSTSATIQSPDIRVATGTSTGYVGNLSIRSNSLDIKSTSGADGYSEVKATYLTANSWIETEGDLYFTNTASSKIHTDTKLESFSPIYNVQIGTTTASTTLLTASSTASHLYVQDASFTGSVTISKKLTVASSTTPGAVEMYGNVQIGSTQSGTTTNSTTINSSAVSVINNTGTTSTGTVLVNTDKLTLTADSITNTLTTATYTIKDANVTTTGSATITLNNVSESIASGAYTLAVNSTTSAEKIGKITTTEIVNTSSALVGSTTTPASVTVYSSTFSHTQGATASYVVTHGAASATASYLKIAASSTNTEIVVNNLTASTQASIKKAVVSTTMEVGTTTTAAGSLVSYSKIATIKAGTSNNSTYTLDIAASTTTSTIAVKNINVATSSTLNGALTVNATASITGASMTVNSTATTVTSTTITAGTTTSTVLIQGTHNLKIDTGTTYSAVVTDNLKVNNVLNGNGFAIYWSADDNALVFTQGNI